MTEITPATANHHASASACFGHNATALLPHCANTSARRLTAPALTNIGERGLNYSNGVGVHDPSDPYPGKPIISKIMVGVTEGQQIWPMVVDNFTQGETVDITHDIIVE